MKTRTLRDILQSARESLAYAVEGVVTGFTEQIVARLDILQLNRVQFAEKIETSPAYVTKLLRGNTNFTLESMVKVARALDSDLRVELVPRVVGQPVQAAEQLEKPQEEPLVCKACGCNMDKNGCGCNPHDA